MPLTPNVRVTQAIQRAQMNDAKRVMSVKDAKTIASTAASEINKTRDKTAEAKAIGAALETLPPHVGTRRAAHVLNVVAARLSNVNAMPAFHTSDGKPADFESLSTAAAALMREAVSPKRKNSGKDIPWNGPENVREIAAGSPPFQEQLNKEGLAYHRERGRDGLTMIMTALVQLGIAQGGRLAKGPNRGLLIDGIKARAHGAALPTNAELKALLTKVEAGELGSPPLPVPGQAKGMLEREGPPFVDAELIAPVRDALTFAFEVRKGPVLDRALEDVLAIGIEQGKRIAKGDDRTSMLLSFAVSSLERGDTTTAKSIADLLR